jgi:hypothetical protein
MHAEGPGRRSRDSDLRMDGCWVFAMDVGERQINHLMVENMWVSKDRSFLVRGGLPHCTIL